jgi:hypothetical protein
MTLTTHCGVKEATVDGIRWLANPALGNGNPPEGWGNPVTSGRWEQTSETTAIFIADSGVKADFILAVSPDASGGCA